MRVKRSVLIGIFTTLISLSVVCAAELKIAYVDAARLLEEAPQAGLASSLLKQEFAKRENEMIELQNELKNMEEKLVKDGPIMSDSERKKVELGILALKRELRRKQEELREDFNIRRNDEIGKLQKYIKQAIESVGKAGEYDLVLYEGISFANPELDITENVLLLLRQQVEAALEQPPDNR